MQFRFHYPKNKKSICSFWPPNNALSPFGKHERHAITLNWKHNNTQTKSKATQSFKRSASLNFVAVTYMKSTSSLYTRHKPFKPGTIGINLGYSEQTMLAAAINRLPVTQLSRLQKRLLLLLLLSSSTLLLLRLPLQLLLSHGSAASLPAMAILNAPGALRRA